MGLASQTRFATRGASYYFSRLRRWAIGLVLWTCAILPTRSFAQVQLILPIVRTPTTLPELWNAVFAELETGEYDRAGMWLTRFWETWLKDAPDEREKFLLDIYDREGLLPFLRLANHPQLDKVVIKDEKTGEAVPVSRALLQQLNQALQKRLGDEKILQFYVERLKGRPGERRYAMAQLVLAGERAVPYLVQVLTDPEQKEVHGNVVTVLRYMRGNAVAPLLTVLADAPAPALRATALGIALEERDSRMIPYLWFAQANPKETPTMREQARRALASLLHRPLPALSSEQPAFVLGDWRLELLRVADDYYHRRAELPPGENLVWWRWEPGKGLVPQTLTRREYQVVAGTYWLRKILDLQPDYRPAQVLLVSLLLEHALEVGGWDKPLTATSPQLIQQLTVLDPRIIEEALGQALTQRKTATAFAALQVLAQIRDARLVHSTNGDVPALVRALYYPDPRVQWLAANTILNTPLPSPFRGSSRVVEILGRAVASKDTKRVVLAFSDGTEARQVAERFRALGYEPALVPSGGTLLREVAKQDADFLVLDMRLADLPLDYVISLLRQSPEAGSVPVLLWGPQSFEQEAKRLAQRFPLLGLAVPAPMSDAMLQHLVQSVSVPNGPPLSVEQRQAVRRAAFDSLWRIARGELALPIEPALPALIAALNDDNLAPSAAAVLAHVRGRNVQETLAKALLAAQRPDAVQIALAQALYDHVQANTYLLGDTYLQQLRQLAQKPVPATVRDIVTRLHLQVASRPPSPSQLFQQLPIPRVPAKP